MDGPVKSAKFEPLSDKVMLRIEEIFKKHGFGPTVLKGDFQSELNDMADKICSVIIHLDSVVDDLQYKLAMARGTIDELQREAKK